METVETIKAFYETEKARARVLYLVMSVKRMERFLSQNLWVKK